MRRQFPQCQSARPLSHENHFGGNAHYSSSYVATAKRASDPSYAETVGGEKVSEPQNVGEQLRLTENVLRNLIASVLEAKLGTGWMDNCGVSPDRVQKWSDKRDEESKKLSTGNLETRLLYFADFYDLKTIILKRWDDFKDVFGDKKELEVLLSLLEDFRNPSAHARGLLPYQESLAVGMCGEIRARVTQYRSKKETTQDCFPRIDSAFDNHGHAFPGPSHERPVLRVGDRIEVVVEASDPEGLLLQYRFYVQNGMNRLNEQDWSSDNRFAVDLSQNHIGVTNSLNFDIRSGRAYHARGFYDDGGVFDYTVLPIPQRRG
jgi:Swt1-like HEPN